MTPERWRTVKAIVQDALDRPASARRAFVDTACADDPVLRAEVESLLATPVTGEQPVGVPSPRDAPIDGRVGNTDVVGAGVAGAAMAALATAADAPFAAALAGLYAIDAVIARGTTATVYRARDVRHGRPVAIKAFVPALSAALGAERFLREIAVTAALHHPHIVPLFDSGEAAGRLYYVTPYVDGETLRARLARVGRLPAGDAVRLAREIADALAHAHARGVVHRDIKPENLLLEDGPDGAHVRIADFGIALAAEQAGGERLTRTGMLVGTPRYMAPEQAAGGAVDARADVYALGTVLYEALAGEPPFVGPTVGTVVRRVLDEAPRPLATRAPATPPALEAAVMKALSKAPDDRFPSAAAFATALGAASGDVPAPGAPGSRSGDTDAPSRSGPAARRGVPVAAVALLTGVALAGGTLLGWTAHAAASRADAAVAAPVRDLLRATRPSAGGGAPAAGTLDGGTLDGAASRLVVVDRAGRLVREFPAERPWTPRFSPDGSRIAYGAFVPGRDESELWVADLRDGAATRLTDERRDDNDPQWSPDGRRLAYSVGADGGKDVVVRAAGAGPTDGAGLSPPLARRGGDQFPTDWLPDASGVLLTEQADGNLDVLVQPAGGGAARPYAATGARESAARASADGRWIAYTSDEEGHDEVYVDAYPTPGRRTRVSTGGGQHPVWARDGRTLYYWQAGALVAASLDPGTDAAPPRVVTRTVLFRAPYAGGLIAMYDVSPDGQRIVLVTGGAR